MSTKKASGFVNPMDMKKVLEDQAGVEPLQLVPPKASTEAQVAKSPALPSPEEIKKHWPEQVVGDYKPDELPWLEASTDPRVKITFQLRLTDKLHKKFAYAAAHTLPASMQTFALIALEEAVDKRLKELGVL